GDVANVKIVKLMPFGAFAEVMSGVDGLIHISQISNRRIGKPDEVLSVGDVTDVKITDIDTEKQKISLSIRALAEPAPKAETDTRDIMEAAPKSEDDALVYEVSEAGEATGIAPDSDPNKVD
ncbi:MAG: S1 RNA-binding domain-containing protein, partial [Clostridiales bacterium]|nr:S1 RNA-binding domain-containing protein [Clostridiales bacterium]